MNGNSLKPTNDTPFAASRHFPQRGQREKAPLKGELAGPTGLTEGFRGRHPQFYETTGEYVQSPLASPGGKLDFLAIGTSKPIDKKD